MAFLRYFFSEQQLTKEQVDIREERLDVHYGYTITDGAEYPNKYIEVGGSLHDISSANYKHDLNNLREEVKRATDLLEKSKVIEFTLTFEKNYRKFAEAPSFKKKFTDIDSLEKYLTDFFNPKVGMARKATF